MSVEPSEPTVAVVSAVTAAIEPARIALSQALPGARVWNLLDDRLMTDAQAAGGLTPPLRDRMHRLIDHALAAHADAVLVTCSLYSEVAAERAGTETVPVVAPDDAAFDAVISAGYRRILLIAPAAEPLADSQSRLARHTAAAGHDVEVIGVLAADLPQGPARTPQTLADALAATVTAAAVEVDAVLLGQYSLAPAAEALHQLVQLPVLSTPSCAAQRLADRLETAGVSR